MASNMLAVALSSSLVLALVGASPAPIARPAAVVVEQPLITPAPTKWDPTQTYKERRDVISDIKSLASLVGGDIGSILTELGSAIPSEVASGVPNFFEGFPTGGAVQSSLGLQDSDVAALPTQVLNVPSYANWTKDGWNMRFRANVYKQPNIPQSKLDDLANVFLIGTSVQSLPPAQASQARNLTAEIYVIQQGDQNVTFSLQPAPQPTGALAPDGGAIPATGGQQTVIYPVPTTPEGDIDGFVPLQAAGLTPGNATNHVQTLNVYTVGTNTGNATSYLVPDTDGLTVVSDIDDILRITKIYQPKEGLLNSFARPFTPWMNMPEIYANWSTSLQDFHFHYLTTTPEQITRNYMQFIYQNYPLGSFDTRPLNFSDVAATLSIRKFLLTRIFETFPKRRFILVGDTSNSDIMRDYPQLAVDHPNNVQCIFLRNTSSTDSGDKFPYDTSGFKGIDQNKYMFFNVPVSLSPVSLLSSSHPGRITDRLSSRTISRI
jgi:phosphatidate phosphatase APP1